MDKPAEIRDGTIREVEAARNALLLLQGQLSRALPQTGELTDADELKSLSRRDSSPTMMRSFY